MNERQALIEQKIDELQASIEGELRNRARATFRFCENEHEMRKFCYEMDEFERYCWEKLIKISISNRLKSVAFIFDLLRDLVSGNSRYFFEHLNLVDLFGNRIYMNVICEADDMAERQKKLEKSKKPQKTETGRKNDCSD
mgnify:CR=1 FL=1